MDDKPELTQTLHQLARQLREAMEEIRQHSFGTRLKSLALREKVRKTVQKSAALHEQIRQRREPAGADIDEAQ